LIAWPKTIAEGALADGSEITYVSLEEAATLIWGIAENQAVEVNGFRLEMSDDEKFELMVGISGDMTISQVATLFRQRLRTHT